MGYQRLSPSWFFIPGLHWIHHRAPFIIWVARFFHCIPFEIHPFVCLLLVQRLLKLAFGLTHQFKHLFFTLPPTLLVGLPFLTWTIVVPRPFSKNLLWIWIFFCCNSTSFLLDSFEVTIFNCLVAFLYWVHFLFLFIFATTPS